MIVGIKFLMISKVNFKWAECVFILYSLNAAFATMRFDLIVITTLLLLIRSKDTKV